MSERAQSFYDQKNYKHSGILCSQTASDKRFLVLLIHGLTIHKNHSPFPEIAQALFKQGIDSFRFDLFAHGESEGDFIDMTVSRALESIEAALHYVKQIGYENISLVGESFAGFCAIFIAVKHPEIRSLCLKSPVSNYIEVESLRSPPRDMDLWKKQGFIIHSNSFGEGFQLAYNFYTDMQNYDAYRAASDIHQPTFILHGDADKVVPFIQSKKLHRYITKSQLKLYPGIGHKFTQENDIHHMVNDIVTFLRG